MNSLDKHLFFGRFIANLIFIAVCFAVTLLSVLIIVEIYLLVVYLEEYYGIIIAGGVLVLFLILLFALIKTCVESNYNE